MRTEYRASLDVNINQTHEIMPKTLFLFGKGLQGKDSPFKTGALDEYDADTSINPPYV